MRITHYHPRAVVGDGGVSNSVRRLSAALAATGTAAAIAYDRRDTPEGVTDGVVWLPVSHRGTGAVRVPIDLAEQLSADDVLVLNSAWTVHNSRAGAVARARRVPYVLAARGAYDPLILHRRRRLKQLWWRAAERRLVQQAAALHVFFDEQIAHVRSLGYNGEVVVAPNGVTVPDDAWWDGGSGGYVLYLGRFDPEHKGLDVLLAAVKALPAHERPDVRLCGPDWKGGKAVVADMVEALGLARWVTLDPPAYGEAKWALLRRARAFVYPSRWEGFGNSLAEAAALGVPSLATPYPLAVHLERAGAATVAAHDAASLGEGLLDLLSQPPPDRAVSQQIRGELTWEAVARRWIDQTARIVSPDRRPGLAERTAS